MNAKEQKTIDASWAGHNRKPGNTRELRNRKRRRSSQAIARRIVQERNA